MLHDIHVFLHDHRFAVLVLSAIVIAFSMRIILAHLRAPDAERRLPTAPPPRPVGKPSAKFAETVRAEDIPRPKPESSVASQLAKARAQTNRMEPVTVGDAASKAAEADDAAMADLFSGLDEDAKHAPTTKEPKSDSQRKGLTETGAIRRVGRMEELGFHRSIENLAVEPGVAPPMPGEPAAAPSSAGDGTTRAEAKAADAKPAAAELDAILARIDQVLSQDSKKTEVADTPAPAAPKPDARTRPTEMMPPSAQPADPRTKQTQVLGPVDSDAKKKPPLWARADAFDEDADKDEKKSEGGTQLGLFDDKK